MMLLLSVLAAAARPKWQPHIGSIESYNDAILALNDNRPADAHDILSAVLTSDPTCGLCRHAQAVSLLQQGHLDDAQDQLQALLALHDRAEVHTLTAVTAARQGDHTTARDASLRATHQDPSSLAAHHTLLRAMIALDDHTQAQRVVQRAGKRLQPAPGRTR